MAAPLKPWERNAVNFHSPSNLASNNSFPGDNGQSTVNSYVQDQYLYNGTAPLNFGGGGSVGPRLPPRPSPPLNSASSFMPLRPSLPSISGYGYGSPYSNGFSPTYGPTYVPNYRGGFGNYPYESTSADGGFIQLAEESSRPAFQSIESIVQAVGSVNMMLESTYFAMHNSFRAVIGVAHHFTQMKDQFTQIFSALALIRSLRWLFRKVLHLIGLRAGDPNIDAVWSNIVNEVTASTGYLGENDLNQTRSNWPFVMFVAIVFGTPWAIWKLLSSITRMTNTKTNDKWMTGDSEHYVAVALYNFTAENDGEVSLQVGQAVRLASKALQPRVRGWLLASVDGKRAGLVPANYIRVLRERKAFLERREAPVADKVLDEQSTIIPDVAFSEVPITGNQQSSEQT